MNSHETMMEQIRRLNQQEAVKHELRKQEVLAKIWKMRKQQRENVAKKPHFLDQNIT